MNDKFVISMMEYVEMDMEAARELLEANNPKTCNHIVLCCQQIIEKALKAFLAKKGVSFGGDHDTKLLCKKASTVNSDFSKYMDICAEFKGIYIATHYPDYEGNKIEFSRKQAENYFIIALEIYEIVKDNM